MFPQTEFGAEQPPPIPFFDRGTFEQVVEFGPRPPPPAPPAHPS